MAVAIRLQRIGRPKQPYYRVVAVDRRQAAQRKPIEILGIYNPRAVKVKEKIQIKQERMDYWLNVGAQPSETVAGLLKSLNKAGAKASKTEKAGEAATTKTGKE